MPTRKDNPVYTTRAKAPTTSAAPDRKRGALLAKTALRPSLQAAATIRQWKPLVGDVELQALMEELGEQARLASAGKMDRAEALLVAQAHTLDAIFNNLARRAAGSEYLPQFEASLRLGLKAQSQCRTTLETLALLRNPKSVAFVSQANISHGPQQVNNGPSPPVASPAWKCESPPNKLLEEQHAERLDIRQSSAPGGADSSMATVATGDRTDNTPR